MFRPKHLEVLIRFQSRNPIRVLLAVAVATALLFGSAVVLIRFQSRNPSRLR